MDECLEYILELLEADEISDEKFVADARSIGLGDFELAQLLVDQFSEEVPHCVNANLLLWHRQFGAPVDRRTSGHQSKTHAFDEALAIVAYRFDLKLPTGSGRCRQAA